jgi:hypothetical protein
MLHDLNWASLHAQSAHTKLGSRELRQGELEGVDLLAEVVQEPGDEMLLLRLAALELRSHLPSSQQCLHTRAALVRRRCVSLQNRR